MSPQTEDSVFGTIKEDEVWLLRKACLVFYSFLIGSVDPSLVDTARFPPDKRKSGFLVCNFTYFALF